MSLPEAGGLVVIEGEKFKHADVVAEAELTLARSLSLELIQIASCWKANPLVSFQAVFRAIYCSTLCSEQRQSLQKIPV